MGKGGVLGAAAALSEKKDKLFQQLAKLDAKEQDTEEFRFIADIIQELMNNPEKTRPCRRAVLSNMWDSEQRALSQSRFGDTTLYLNRVPKEWLRDRMPPLCGLSSDMLNALEKAQKGSLHRILCRICALELNSSMPTRAHEDFFQICKARASAVGKVTFDITNEAGAKISPKAKSIDQEVLAPLDWARCGWYKLLPPAPAENTAGHVYTRVSVAAGKFEVALPEFYKITGIWTITDSHGLRSAFISPPKGTTVVAKDVKLKLLTAFADDDGFQAWLPAATKGIQLGGGKRASNDDVGEALVAEDSFASNAKASMVAAIADGEVGQAASSTACTSSVGATPTPKKRPKLSPGKLKMLLG